MKFLLFIIFTFALSAQDFKTVTFASTDNITITGDLYMMHSSDAPFIVLFHQAGWSRGEYREIAPKLNALGFNCLAIDQRSGKSVNNVLNETAKMATEKKLATNYIDAIPDMIAAVNYARKQHANGKLIVWGSSYSSALVLNLVGSNQIQADAVLSFAPGEYFAKQGKTKTFIQDAAQHISVPVFITSAKSEEKNWKSIKDKIEPTLMNGFIPSTKGNHGSRALWEKFSDHPAYWEAVSTFLKKIK